MDKKIQQFQEGFIKHQYELVDEIIKKQDGLNLTDPKERTLYTLLEGSILNLIFRLKGIINTIKELNDEEIEVPVKYEKYFKIAKEMVYMKGDELTLFITDGQKEEELTVNELIEKIKISKNGQSKKDSK